MSLHYLPHAIVGAILTGLGTVGKFFMSRLISDVKAEWTKVTARLERIESVQIVQSENHLATIESNTTRTNELLEKIHDGQMEMSGFLKGMTGKP